MKTIYLHIGTEKTGTTYIQNAFKNNRDILEKFGYIYPRVGYSANPLAHFSLVAPLCKIEQNEPNLDFVPHCNFTADEEWGKLAKIIDDNLDKNFIISAEHFSSRLKSDGIDYIKGFFDNYSDTHDVKIIIYIRRQDEFVGSAYSTHLKSGGKLSKEEFYKKALERDYYFDFLKIIDNWSSRFGLDSIIVKPFEKIQMKEGLLFDFCQTINFNGFSDLILQNKALNESLSTFAMRFGHIVNKNLDGIEKRKILNFISNSTSDLNLECITPKDKALLLYEYMDDNEYIARHYMKRLDGKLFYSERPTLAEDDDAFSDINDVVGVFIDMLYKSFYKGGGN